MTAEVRKEGSAENPYIGERFAPYYSGQVQQVSDVINRKKGGFRNLLKQTICK